MSVVLSEIPVVTAATGLSPVLPGGHLPWLTGLRQAALAAFQQQGLPHRRTEAFKYSFAALGVVGKLDFVPALIAGDATLEALPAALPAFDGHKVVLLNGSYAPHLSDRAALPAGVEVQPLASLLAHQPERLEGLLGSLVQYDEQPFAALASGLVDDGVVVLLEAGTVLDRPLHIVSITLTPGDAPVMAQPRLLIKAGAGSTATILESHVALGETETLSLPVAEILVEPNARLTHLKVRNDTAKALHVASRTVKVLAGGVYQAFALSLGGAVARDDIAVELAGEQAVAHLNGAYAARDYQHMDTTIHMDHAVPNGRSSQVYKGVLADHGRGVFQGKVTVRKGAQHTDGQQLHKALLLSESAEVDVKPELKIYADDVTCSHGAACGELDDEALFYLRARGLDEATARDLLIEGFLDDVVEQVEDDAIRTVLVGLVRAWLDARQEVA
ncbi:Fe-S cluster assembly protein SufD [Insolitispirillum peregrinum]|uniref:Fe-S cluster assembly protein SufD n=1 Tax=Insolitispirillum peregrinum TaxID=80876 RepID=UPI003619DD4F